MKDRISCPIGGKVIYLEHVNDDAFSQKMLGDGMGIIPEIGIFSSSQEVCAPVDGEVITVFDTKHAICLESEMGTQILIHIGIDTVSMNGDGFVSHVSAGDKVHVGDRLITVDFKKIKKAGFDPVVLTLCTNSEIQKEAAEGKAKKGVVLYTVEDA